MIDLNGYQPLGSVIYQEHSESDDVISLDTSRLRTQHITEGYRDGITTGKADSLQGGFDEGFGLGANVGLKAGHLLGLLEGIVDALRESGLHSALTDQLLSTATKELSTNSIFAEEYWASDGNWTYTVQGSRDDGEVLFEDVASKHPVIMKWEKLVREEVRTWGLDQNLTVLGSDVSQSEAEASPARVQAISRQAVDW
ncbi:hypothetical protein F4677DRAFT_344456 [Hypoxylon crocopeplum]|nr:hypothetical protein F4677DRAFT_344456 [Hypoxylon crocopeplum]